MATMLVRHTVQDFAKWKKVFDEHAATRKAAGSKGGELFQAAGNPLDVTILFHWDTVDNARKFSESPDLKTTMERAGVTGPPQIQFLQNEVKIEV